MRPQWYYDNWTHADWHVLAACLVAFALGWVVWRIMSWAEKRWNRDTPKNRRLPR